MAPDAKARSVLPTLFPQGRAFASPAPNAPEESEIEAALARDLSTQSGQLEGKFAAAAKAGVTGYAANF